jgi:hypothetical protein
MYALFDFPNYDFFPPGRGSNHFITIILAGEPANLADASGEDYPLDPDYKLKTMLVMSVKNPANGECLAVVQAINKTFNPVFTGEDEQILNSFCSQIASLIKRRVLEAMYQNATGEGGDEDLRNLLGQYAGKTKDSGNDEEKVSVHDSSKNQSGSQHKVTPALILLF